VKSPAASVERRTVHVPVKFRASKTPSGAPKISGHCAVFNSLSSDLGGFKEQLAPGCFANALQRRGDQLLLLNHDMGSILARRSAGTLTLREDGAGLYFEAELVNTQLGRDVAELCRTGHLDSCSFAFTVEPEGEHWASGTFNEQDVRTITEVAQLFECSLVAIPAYDAAGFNWTSEGDEGTGTDPNLSAQDLVVALRSRPKRQRAPRIQGGSNAYQRDKHSWFRDLAAVCFSERRAERNPGRLGTMQPDGSVSGVMRPGTDPGNERIPTPGGARVDLMGARDRLQQVRALVTTEAGSGGALVPAGMPPQLSEAFTTAARAEGVLDGILGHEPIPRGAGLTDKIPGFTTGVLAGSQSSEGEAATEQKPSTEWQSSGVVMIDATVEASQQLVDLAAAPGLDRELAEELGAALATKFDQQVLNGTGSSKQTLGLLNTSGITSTTFTQASPTVQEYIREGIGACWSAVYKARGRTPDTILMSPVFYAWTYSGYDSGSKRPMSPHLLDAFCEPDQVPNMPLKLGSNTDEVPTLILRKDDVRLYCNPPQIVAAPDTALNGELTVRYTIRQLLALVARKPAGVGVILGTGTKESPAFT